MRFKINDLFVVLPDPVTHVDDTCGAASCTRCTQTRHPTVPGDLLDLDRYRESLIQLKAQLQGQLAVVEAQERVLDEGMRPRTHEEIDALETRLTGALSELKAMKAKLSKSE